VVEAATDNGSGLNPNKPFWKQGKRPTAWAFDADKNRAWRKNFFADYENLAELKEFEEKDMPCRFLVTKTVVGRIQEANGISDLLGAQTKFHSRRYPSPNPANDTYAASPQIVLVKSSDKGLESMAVPLGLMPEYEAEGWSQWDHPERPTNKKKDDADLRHCPRVEDVRVADAPYKETVSRFKKGIEMLRRSEGTEWLPGMLHDGSTNYPEDSTSFASSFLLPNRESPNQLTATSASHVQRFRRPAKVGLGWGDYGEFYEWQAHGRQVKLDMLTYNDWEYVPKETMGFVSDTGRVKIIQEEIKGYEVEIQRSREGEPTKKSLFAKVRAQADKKEKNKITTEIWENQNWGT
jgi:hypothetical protein